MNDDSKHKAPLEALERKRNLVKDLIDGVCRGYKTGLYLYGPGGVGKSSTVFRHLEAKEVPYQLYNTRMTAKGLFQALAAAPSMVHVMEDMERLTRDPDAQGVLRSALWCQPGHKRMVTWTTATEGRQRFEFNGGLILISNRPLADLPELRALATRIEVYRMDVSDDELTALMLDVASKGLWADGILLLPPAECVQVTEYLLKECRSAGCPLDLRLQQKAFQSYRQHAAYLSMSHWEDLVAASVREANCHFRHEQDTATPDAKKASRRNIVREVMAAFPDAKTQADEYAKRAKASRADFFRRKHEVESGEFDEFDAA